MGRALIRLGHTQATSACRPCASARNRVAANSRSRAGQAREQPSESAFPSRRLPPRLARNHGEREMPTEEAGVTDRVRVLIVDDHAVVRRGLRMFLEDDPQLEIVGEAADGEEGVRLARETRPDVVLMDLLLPKLGGIEATEKIRQELPDTQVIALTSVLEDASVVGAVKAGAIGYLLKNTEGDELLNAIHAAAEGQVRLSPEASARLVREIRSPQSPETLTERETEVLRLLAEGKANKEIARTLRISEQTVKSHVHSLLAKLGMQSRTQAALYAARIGLVSTEQVGRGPT